MKIPGLFIIIRRRRTKGAQMLFVCWNRPLEDPKITEHLLDIADNIQYEMDLKSVNTA